MVQPSDGKADYVAVFSVDLFYMDGKRPLDAVSSRLIEGIAGFHIDVQRLSADGVECDVCLLIECVL